MKKVKILVFILIAGALAAALWYYFQGGSSKSAFLPGEWELAEKDKLEYLKKKAAEREKAGPETNGSDMAQGDERFVLAFRELAEIKRALPSRDLECEKAAEKLFSDNNLIDPHYKFYQNTDRVIEKFHDTFTQTMYREEAIEGYEILSQMIKHDMPIDPKEAYDTLREFNICRPNKSLNFIETAIEASKLNNYDQAVKNELFYVAYMMMETMTGNNFSVESLTTNLGLMKMMVDKSLLPKEAAPEINALYQKIKDQEVLFRKGFSIDNSKEQNYRALKEDILSKESLGAEMRELMQNLRQKYIPEFDI